MGSDQQVFHLAAVLIEWMMRLGLLWRVLCALASVSSSYREKIAFERGGGGAAKGSTRVKL